MTLAEICKTLAAAPAPVLHGIDVPHPLATASALRMLARMLGLPVAALESCDHRGQRLGAALGEVAELVRRQVKRMNRDRAFGPDYEAARDMVKSGRILAAARSAGRGSCLTA
jgi:hypothetical protein